MRSFSIKCVSENQNTSIILTYITQCREMISDFNFINYLPVFINGSSGISGETF